MINDINEEIDGTGTAFISGRCNRCGGELRHLRDDNWICPACGNRAILDLDTCLFYFDYLGTANEDGEPA